jgi:aminotransferase
MYHHKRQIMLNILDEAQVSYFAPKGAYYVFCDISNFGYQTDLEFTHYLVKEIGVACVPGSSFFSRKELGHKFVRFCFSKKPETLQEAKSRLVRLKDSLRCLT